MKLALSLFLSLAALPIYAHEIGTTRVSVVFHHRSTYDIEIVTDAASLAEKLAQVAGLPAATDTNPQKLHQQLAAATDRFRQRVKIRFDDTSAQPEVAATVAPGPEANTAVATLRLHGEIPAGAKAFQWTYGWTFASYALGIRNSESEDPATEWLEGGQGSAPFQLSSPAPVFSRLQTIWQYVTLGFTHIVPEGLDHMLFVLGIYLLSGRARTVLLQVSAFTVAHSITLGLSMYGLVHVSSSIVEPLIAVSIAYVAVENIFLRELKSWRVALVFSFGLLHGMGFAGALKELGLPRSEFVTALLSFNIGVEAGQLAVIAAAFLLVGWRWSERPWYRSRIVVPASAMIACMAVYWTVERLAV